MSRRRGLLYFVENPNFVIIDSIVLDGLKDIFFFQSVYYFNFVCIQIVTVKVVHDEKKGKKCTY